MKGKNPFMLWGEDPRSIIGRNNELGIFNSFLNAVSSGQPLVVLVSGGPGSGKTLLLRRMLSESERQGLLPPYVKMERGEDGRTLVAKLQRETAAFLRILEEGRLRKGRPSAIADSLEGRTAGSMQELVRYLSKELRGAVPGILFFIDDFDAMRKSAEAFSSIAESVRGVSFSIGFVVSSSQDFSTADGAVRRMALGPFTDHDITELVNKALGKGPPKMGEQCLQSIIADSGGNPRLVKTICWVLYDRLKETDKIITRGHYLAAMPSLMSLLGREWFGALYGSTPESERAILRVLAEGGDMHISDVAKKLGKPLGPTTALAKRLLESGQITKVGRGVYRVFSRLYGRYVLGMP